MSHDPLSAECASDEANAERRLAALEKRLEGIESRNTRVELEKAWEVSAARKAVLACGTYGVCTCLMAAIGVERYFLNALIPTTGYLISVLTLAELRRRWIARRYGE